MQDDIQRNATGMYKCEDRLNIISKSAVRFEHYMEDFNNRLLRLEGEATKNEVLISGIPERDGEDLQKVFKDFRER